MSTRSNICIQNEDGSFDVIYCHFDGYLSQNGQILLDNYADPSKVRALIAPGDLSSLAAEIGEKHNFNNSPDGECNYYGRDRGEKGVEARHMTAKEFGEHETEEYVYLFRDGSWFYADHPRVMKAAEFKPLTKEAIDGEGEDS